MRAPEQPFDTFARFVIIVASPVTQVATFNHFGFGARSSVTHTMLNAFLEIRIRNCLICHIHGWIVFVTKTNFFVHVFFIGINLPSPPSNLIPKADSSSFALLQISTFGSALKRLSKRWPASWLPTLIGVSFGDSPLPSQMPHS